MKKSDLFPYVYSTKEGYDKLAPFYDSWHWQFFWKENELPILNKWCEKLAKGIGADLGAGSGNSLYNFLEMGHHVDAYDVSPNMLRICKMKHLKYILSGNLTCYNCDVRFMYYSPKRYDWMICNRMLSNVSDVSDVARVMGKLLKKNGRCFISDVHPDHKYLFTHLKILNFNINIETYKHSIKNVLDSFFDQGFELECFRKYEMKDLYPTVGIKHYSPNEPIFYVIELKKK